jgi:hypothetical protein
MAFYVPAHAVGADVCKALIDGRDWWMRAREGLKLYESTPGRTPYEISDTIFTGRVAIYLEGYLDASVTAQLRQYGSEHNLDVLIRDHSYAEERDVVERPHAFISHDSRDKESVARPLATTLSMNLCRVWYDEFSLNVGDSLRRAIEDGLKRCHKCVVTPNFLENGRWTRREYDSLFTRELVEERALILPVWAGVTKEKIYEFSPVLADRVAAIWKQNTEDVARQLLKVLL